MELNSSLWAVGPQLRVFRCKKYMKCTAIRTLYRLAFAPARKPYQIGPLFTYKKGDFGAISVAYVKS